MKIFNSKTLGMMTALLFLTGVWSCSDDVQPVAEAVTTDDVPAAIQADFTQCYPEATDVTWTITDGYAVASFNTTVARSASNNHSTMWYGLNDHQKKMHSTPVLFSELPAAVSTAFSESEYATLTPAEYAHAITRYVDGNADRIYVIEAKGALEGTAFTAVKLYYTEDGVLVKLSSQIVYDESFVDSDSLDEYKEWLPQAPADFVSAFVDANYPGARYLYIYEGRDFTKVKILDVHTARLILFDVNGTWVSTATEIDDDHIPAEILAAFRASEFAGWHIDNITEYLTASDGHYYLLSLKDGKNKAELRIDADGNVAENPVTPPATPEEPAVPDTPTDGSEYLTKTEIEGFILARYPGASIRKYDYDDDEAEVEINYNGLKIKVEFDLYAQGYLWNESEWDFDVRNTATLPSAVVDTLSAGYADYRLQYLTFHELALGTSYYEAGLKSAKTKKELTLKIDEQGNVIAEYSKH